MSSTPPLILVSPSTQPAGAEMLDHSISVSSRYFQAIFDAGGLPMCLPLTTNSRAISAAIRRVEGVLLTGGDDIHPELYWPDAPSRLLDTCDCAEPARDVMELEIIREVFRQGKPLLAICRGNQLVNVALGGTLFVDLPSQWKSEIQHSRLDQRCDKVHGVRLEKGSKLSRMYQREEIEVNSTHHQNIDKLAEPLWAVGIAQDGLIEAIELKPDGPLSLPWFAGVQFHPERLYDRYPEHARMFRAFIAACRSPRG